MKFRLLGILTLLSASAFAGPRVFVGFGFGGGPRYYAPPPPVVYYAPPPPVAYYNPPPPPVYYAPPAYRTTFWVGPRWYGGRYYRGYWRR